MAAVRFEPEVTQCSATTPANGTLLAPAERFATVTQDAMRVEITSLSALRQHYLVCLRWSGWSRFLQVSPQRITVGSCVLLFTMLSLLCCSLFTCCHLLSILNCGHAICRRCGTVAAQHHFRNSLCFEQHSKRDKQHCVDECCHRPSEASHQNKHIHKRSGICLLCEWPAVAVCDPFTVSILGKSSKCLHGEFSCRAICFPFGMTEISCTLFSVPHNRFTS